MAIVDKLKNKITEAGGDVTGIQNIEEAVNALPASGGNDILELEAEMVSYQQGQALKVTNHTADELYNNQGDLRVKATLKYAPEYATTFDGVLKTISVMGGIRYSLWCAAPHIVVDNNVDVTAANFTYYISDIIPQLGDGSVPKTEVIFDPYAKYLQLPIN